VIRFLIDENLPGTLAARLSVPCMHATDLEERPTDEALWVFAKSEDWIILTKDADFFDRLALQGPPPKVVWLRTGNRRRHAQDDFIAARMAMIIQLLGEADLVEVHEDRLETFTF
jgi:predicted nuclease of predicted toxin-antitoxin system